MSRPTATCGMHHVALNVSNLAACEHFYVELLGMQVEWRPDERSVYLTSGKDNVALHHTDKTFADGQHLNHIGFIFNTKTAVDEWYHFLQTHDVPMKTAPRTHRDGAHSFYCYDPDGNTVQFICHPPLVDQF